MTTYRLEVACNTLQGAEFVQWLNEKGHDAKLGNSTGDYVNGEITSNQEAPAGEIMRSLWTEFCCW